MREKFHLASEVFFHDEGEQLSRPSKTQQVRYPRERLIRTTAIKLE